MEESIQPPNCGEVPVFALGNIKSGDPDRGQAEHVTLPFLCLCLAGGSKMGKGEKPPLNHVLGLAEKSWIGGQTLSLTGNSTRLGALWHQRPCLPHLMRCSLSAGLCLIICFLIFPNI